MRQVSAATALAITLAAAPAAHAEMPSPTYSPDYARCQEASGGVTVNMLNCIADEMQRADKRLNAAYRKARANAPARKALLTTAQRAWLAYRKSNCEYYAEPDGGSIVQIVVNECFLRMTTERAGELEVLAEPAI